MLRVEFPETGNKVCRKVLGKGQGSKLVEALAQMGHGEVLKTLTTSTRTGLIKTVMIKAPFTQSPRIARLLPELPDSHEFGKNFGF